MAVLLPSTIAKPEKGRGQHAVGTEDPPGPFHIVLGTEQLMRQT